MGLSVEGAELVEDMSQDDDDGEEAGFFAGCRANQKKTTRSLTDVAPDERPGNHRDNPRIRNSRRAAESLDRFSSSSTSSLTDRSKDLD